MASLSASRVKHATLSGTTVDTVTLTGDDIDFVEVTNRSGTTTLFFTTDGATAPTSGGDDNEFALAGESVMVAPYARGTSGVVVKVLGNGNDYSVAAVSV